MKKEKLNIIYEDKDLIVVNKKSGLLTISTKTEKVNTLYHQVGDYLKKQNKNNKVFIIHRLDKDTSGLIIFAKNEKVKELLQANWNQTKRKYYGIVYGDLKKENEVLVSYLKESKSHLVYSTRKNGKKAITEYQVINSNSKYSLLDINIKTGRKHQIRVQLNDLGNPLVGDKKYAKSLNKGQKRLYLHAYYLELCHPITKQNLILETSLPIEFKKIISL